MFDSLPRTKFELKRLSPAGKVDVQRFHAHAHHHKPEPIRNAPRWPKPRVGFGDVESADEGLAAVSHGGGTRKNSLVWEERHPLGTAFYARFVRTNPARDTKWKRMFDSLPGRKFEFKRLFPAGKVDGKMAAARGEKKSETNLDKSRDVFHRSNPPHGRRRLRWPSLLCPAASHYEPMTDRDQGGLRFVNKLTNLLVFFAVGCVALPRVVPATARPERSAAKSKDALPPIKNPPQLIAGIGGTRH